MEKKIEKSTSFLYQGILFIVLGIWGLFLGQYFLVGGILAIIAGILRISFKKYPLIIDKEHLNYKSSFNSSEKYILFKDINHISVGSNKIIIKSKDKTVTIKKNVLKSNQWNAVQEIFKNLKNQ